MSSNSGKRLRTERRLAVTHNTKWLQDAEARRQAVQQQCLEAAPVPVAPTAAEGEQEAAVMREGAAAAGASAMEMSPGGKATDRKKGKRGRGRVVGTGINKRKGKKVSVLAGQFHKKKKKGVRGRP